MQRLGHPLWQAAHRPLFLCAALWALLAPAVWLWPGGLGADPVRWHLHELLFGMGGAAVGGYLLTALPSWTGAGPVSAQTLRALTLLWLLARLAHLVALGLPIMLHLALALGYFAALAWVMAHHLIAARVLARLWVSAAIVGLASGNAVFLVEARGGLQIPTLPLAMVLLFAGLISVIGGRAVPAFTRSGVQHAHPLQRVRDWPAVGTFALLATALGGGLALNGQATAPGLCLLLAGLLQSLRFTAWQTLRIRHNRALLMLHLAWLWLPLGLILLGIALLRPDLLPQSAALHALTMGAMSLMIMAIAGRAAMARQNGTLVAGTGLMLAFALVWLAALLRVASPLLPPNPLDPIIASAALWMLGWGVFLWAFRPALFGPVPWPILSARRR